jgi:hypothetical protein
MSLTLTSRFHEIVRQTSIRTIYEALVELITNSVDSYNRNGMSKRDIWVTIHRGEPRTSVSVTDQAGGMSREEMLTNLLTIGSYTASENSRGFFGRGCKDCSFLGDIQFTCFKNGMVNQLTIKQDRNVTIDMEDVTATEDHRSEYGILQNGTHISIFCSASIIRPISRFYSSLRNNIYLRNIYMDSLVVLKEKAQGFDKLVTFSYPDRKLIISADYDVPGYNTSAHLEIYRSVEKMPFPPNRDERQYGINVQSSRSIFENCALYHDDGGRVQDYIFNPNIQYISGSITCDSIETLAKDSIDGNNRIELKDGIFTIDPMNPFLVIDPNRREGLVKSHPFTVALYRHAYQLLSIIIERIQDMSEEDLLGNGNSADLMKSLADFINQMLPESSPLYVFRTHEDQEKLNQVVDSLKNVNLDNEFLGLTWEQIQALKDDKYLNIDKTTRVNNGMDISFSNDPTMQTPYIILYLPGKISLKLNVNDPSLKPFITMNDESVDMINVGKGMTAVGSMVVDAISDVGVRRDIIKGKTSSLNIDGFNGYQYLYNNIRSNIAGGIYSRVMSSIEATKAGNETDGIIT